MARRDDDRLEELDALRGIAAALVLLHHAIQLLPAVPTPDIAGAGWLRYALTQLTPLRVVEFGRPAVLFFFVLSGFVLTRALLRHGSPGLAAFAAQRTVRLGLPVLASVLLSVGLYALLFDPAVRDAMAAHSLFTWLEPPSAAAVLSNALLLAPNPQMRLNVVLWSLVHEWRLSLLLPLVLLFRGRLALFGAAVLAAVALGVLGGATENQVLLGPRWHSTLPATFYFAGGLGAGAALALRCEAGLPRLSPEQRLAAGVAAAALFSLASDAAAYAGSVLLILLAVQPGRLRAALRRPPFPWLGGLSFSLYLVHAPVLVAGLHALHGRISPWLVPLVGVVAAFGAAMLMHRLVERPARRLARRVEARLSRPARPAEPPGPRPQSDPAPPWRADWGAEGGLYERPG